MARRDRKKIDFSFSWSALDDSIQFTKKCDARGCSLRGEYPAPKSPRELEQRLYFCLDHVREHNASWNFYADMAPEEAHYQNEQDKYGGRPSWVFGHKGVHEKIIQELDQFLRNHHADSHAQGWDFKEKQPFRSHARSTPEAKAVSVLELAVPFTLFELKAQYKIKAKIYHPDLNHGEKEAEVKFREIKEAYELLKSALTKL